MLYIDRYTQENKRWIKKVLMETTKEDNIGILREYSYTKCKRRVNEGLTKAQQREYAYTKGTWAYKCLLASTNVIDGVKNSHDTIWWAMIMMSGGRNVDGCRKRKGTGTVICPELETPANYNDNHWNSMEINGGTRWPPTKFIGPHCNLQWLSLLVSIHSMLSIDICCRPLAIMELHLVLTINECQWRQ